MKILAAVDGSPYTKRMLAYLAAHDEWLGAAHSYTLIHTVPAVPPRAAAVMDKTELQAYYAEATEKVFKPLRSFMGKQKLQAEFVGKVGLPADCIVAAAQRGKYDLIMMGSHGNGTLKSLLMGSVTTKVLSQTETPVLLIR